jgi:hypothetical protein
MISKFNARDVTESLDSDWLMWRIEVNPGKIFVADALRNCVRNLGSFDCDRMTQALFVTYREENFTGKNERQTRWPGKYDGVDLRLLGLYLTP